MRELLEGIELDGVPLFPPYYDDDVADRLSHRQTTAILALFALMVVTMEFVGEPINCWTPAHFRKPQETYADRLTNSHSVAGVPGRLWKLTHCNVYENWSNLSLV